MCIEFKILKVKVLVIFLAAVGFSLRRDGRYQSYFHPPFGCSPRASASPTFHSKFGFRSGN
jgi:hypothetical protein